MSNTKKTFDAVAMMRSIRDQLSAQIAGMTEENTGPYTVDETKLKKLLKSALAEVLEELTYPRGHRSCGESGDSRGYS